MPELTAEIRPIPVDELDISTQPVTHWIPQWLVLGGKACEVGVAIDDGCLVVLVKNLNDQWVPTSHIPRQIAVKLGDLAFSAL